MIDKGITKVINYHSDALIDIFGYAKDDGFRVNIWTLAHLLYGPYNMVFSWINPLLGLGLSDVEDYFKINDPICDGFLDFLNSVIVLNFTNGKLPI